MAPNLVQVTEVALPALSLVPGGIYTAHTVQEGLICLSEYTILLLEDRDHQSHLIGSTTDSTELTVINRWAFHHHSNTAQSNSTLDIWLCSKMEIKKN